MQAHVPLRDTSDAAEAATAAGAGLPVDAGRALGAVLRVVGTTLS
jgi:hypothetical protein